MSRNSPPTICRPRRRVLSTIGTAVGGIAIAGCTSDDPREGDTAPGTTPGNEAIREELGLSYPEYKLEDELNVLQWSEYWHDTAIKNFEAAFDVSVTVDLYDSNEELYDMLTSAESGAYDVAFPSGWMATRLIDENRLQPLELEKVGNWDNLAERWVEDAPYDIGDERYSMPYQWGTTGIAWNRNMIDRGDLGSWDVMWNDSYAGQIRMLHLPRETYAASLKRLGYSLNTTDVVEIEEATDMLVQQADLVGEYAGDNFVVDLIGEVWSPMHTYSGPAIAAYWELYENGQSPIEYRIPQEGGVIWIDTAVITAEARHPNAAHAFVDYILDDVVGASITNFNFYATPNEAAEPHIDDAILNNPAIYPPADVMERLEFIEDLGDASIHYEDGWERVMAAHGTQS